MTRFAKFGGIALACMALLPGVTCAQAFPSKPIHFLVPFPPGGGSGIVAQMLGPKLSEVWGQPVVVENRPGGNTVIGHEALLRLPADGHAFVISTPSFILTALFQKLSYDPYADFAPLTTLYNSEQVLTITPSLPVNNLKELIAYAKARPGQLNYATVGSGGSTHLASELLNMMAGIDTRQVNYKGAGPALVDQIGGHVQMSFTAPSAALAHINSGKIRAIAITGDKRTPAMANVPTMAEAGIPDFGGTIWFGVQAHGKTPRAIVNRLSKDISSVVMRPEVSEELVKQATQPYVMTPEAFAARIRSDAETYARIIKTANIKFE
jgi:tripartite-type tricarboxylate transporter receptor subunit TctC